VDCFILRYLLVILVRVNNRAVFDAGVTARALVLPDIPGLLNQRCFEVSCFPFYAVNFSVSEDLYVGMPADLDQLGCEYSHRAVVGREGLVELGHMAPDARRLFNEVHLKTGGGKIKRCLNTADSSTDDQYVSEITVSKTLAKLLHVVS